MLGVGLRCRENWEREGRSLVGVGWRDGQSLPPVTDLGSMGVTLAEIPSSGGYGS